MTMDPLEREYRSKYREPKNDVDRIDEMREKLYSRVEPIKKNNFKSLRPRSFQVNESWPEEEQKKIEEAPKPPKFNKFVWFFLFAVIGCVAALVYAGVVWFTRAPQISPDNVDIQVVGPITVDGGDPFSMQIVVSNNNAVDLELSDLIIEFPEGAKTPDGGELKRTSQSLGTIRPGEVVKRDVGLILYGNERTNQTINIRLIYHVAGSVSVYEKSKPTVVALGESPLAVVVNMIKETVSGQRFNIDVDVTSNSKAPTDNVILTVDYPFGFNFLESSVKPMVGTNNVFEFERLEPGSTNRVRITGTMGGSDGDTRAFRFATGIKDSAKPTNFSTIFATDIKDIVLTKPFLGAQFAFRDSGDNLIVDPQGAAPGTLTIVNNTATPITNVSIHTKLNSPILDRSTVDASAGFYRSVDNTIVWDMTTFDRLKSVAPGESIDLGFVFATKGLVDGTTLFKNPEVVLTTDIKGRRISENNVAEDLERTVVTNVKVNSQVDLDSHAVYSIGPFKNIGPLPPRVEEETTYTINWILKNTSNTIDNVRVTAQLPNYMVWKNIAHPDGSNLSYDSANRTISWNIGTVESGVGYDSSSKSISFQVGFFPSLSQVLTTPELIRDVTINYKDRFTGQDLSRNYGVVDLGLENDPIFDSSMDTVVQ